MYGIAKVLKKSIQTGKRVTEIKYTNSADPKAGLTVVTNTSATSTYSHVINTVPLGAMQAMNMSDLKLDYPKKLAIRSLTYDPAMKIGMKFNSRWWQNLPAPFKGGQSFSDLPIRRCVYPSYGVNTSDAAGTMIASYVSDKTPPTFLLFRHLNNELNRLGDKMQAALGLTCTLLRVAQR